MNRTIRGRGMAARLLTAGLAAGLAVGTMAPVTTVAEDQPYAGTTLHILMEDLTETHYIADLLLTYRMLKTTTLTLSGSQSIGPSTVGSLYKRETVRLGLTHAVNSKTTLGFSADATSSTGSGSTTEYLSGSVSLSYVPARDWTAQLSYRYLHVNPKSTGSAGQIDPITGFPLAPTRTPVSSNSVLVVLTREFTVLPHGP